jgi:hypothetical protein
MQKEHDNEHKVSAKLLQVLETTMINYAKVQGIINPYWYFGEVLGYKSKNTLYDWFSSTGTKKIGYADLWKIIRITHSRKLIHAIILDIKEAEKTEGDKK